MISSCLRGIANYLRNRPYCPSDTLLDNAVALGKAAGSAVLLGAVSPVPREEVEMSLATFRLHLTGPPGSLVGITPGRLRWGGGFSGVESLA